MVAFNVPQLTSFFVNACQLILPPNIQGRLSSEGLDMIKDFEHFKEEELKAAFQNMRTSVPGGSRGVALKSKLPKMAACADSEGLWREYLTRFNVIIA